MLRTAALGSLAATVVMWSWLRLEVQPDTRRLLLSTLVLGVVPFLASRRWRPAAAAGAALLTLRVVFGTWSPGEMLDRFGDGFLRYYDVALPFNPAFQPAMHELVTLAVVGFTFAVTFAIAARRPLLAAGLLVGGAGWPATLRQGDSPLAEGALILAAALAIVGGLTTSIRARHAIVAGVAIVAAAVGLAAIPGVAKGAFVAWEKWDPYTKPDLPVSVSYVWETTYQPLDWPEKKTVVFRVQAPPISRYWRATTLDMFNGDSWLEFQHTGSPGTPVRDPLLPRGAVERARLLRARVEIEGLQDGYLIGASIPLEFEVDEDELGTVLYRQTGTATVSGGIPRGTEYTAISLASRPAPSVLIESRPSYGVLHEQYLVLQERTDTPPSPPFGRPGREAQLGRMFAENFQLTPYRPLYEQARQIVGDAQSPYLAAVRIENWFRSGGGFRYDQSAGASTDRPTLVDFVTRTRRGYCQHFAGAMALMLRYLGIPARVAAGFTSGRYSENDREWVVTDHDAHTWVEVWFAGHGWLPFDPTPGRGTLDGAYTSASVAFNLASVAGLAAGADAADAKLARDAAAETRGDARGGGRDLPGDVGGVAREQPSLLRLVALVALALLAAVATLKYALRRARFLTRDPRRVAAACRRDLADFLADQRVLVPASATVAEVGEIARHEFGVDPERFVDAVAAARYGPPEQADRAARSARRELRRLEREARKRLSRFERARGLVSVRSLGLA